ncbi:MspA family porin [Nocardia sp. NPDC005366]|uniref:MspA family porin n=1 Tax=Nocardia sp. NPDC005366 TaxID=3156878 RepID=UPI0033ABEA20
MKSSTRALLCTFTAAALGLGGAGALGFDGAIAAAEQTADKSRVVTTDDGWELRITKSAENVDRQPNLANSPLSREAFVSLSAVADIGGGGRVAVDSGSLQLGYQLGCQVDVSSGLTMSLGVSMGPSVGISTTGVNVGVGAQVVPSMSMTAKPGSIVSLPFGTKALAGAHGSISTDQVQIKVDGCLGAVSLRSYAIVSISTATADNSISVYGDPVWL